MIKKLLLILATLILLLIAGLSVNQYIKKTQDLNDLESLGTAVETSAGTMQVHRFGEGEPLVFLSGLGTTSPYHDFKSLWGSLQDEYEIIIIERPGYGYNQTSSSDKSIDTVVTGYQEALKSMDRLENLTLVAHSMAGLEALYWAQTKPAQIKQIIALDPSIPEITLNHTDLPNLIERNMQFMLGFTGLARFMDDDDLEEALPIITFNHFSDDEISDIKALFFANFFNRNIVREINALKDNANTVDDLDKPIDIPILVFLSKENLAENKDTQAVFESYFAGFNTGELHILDTHHYVHHEKASSITDAINQFGS